MKNAGLTKVAVTGATGFVGRHVVSSLLSHGVKVVATGRDRSRLASSFPSGVQLVELDMRQPVAAFERLGRPDVVVHLAWEGLPNYTANRHFEEELPRQYAFLRGLVEDGASSLVIAGTCFEYGLTSGPVSETVQPNPNTAYALAKHTLHRQLQFLQQGTTFLLTWARLFYLYGDGQAPSSLWSQLQSAIDKGDKEFRMSGGEQLRDFLPIEEAGNLIGRLAMLRRGVGSVNVCSGKPRSVRGLVESWLAARGSQMRLNLGHYPYPPHEPMAFWGDAEKIGTVLDSE